MIPFARLSIISLRAAARGYGDIMGLELLLCDIGNTSIKIGLADSRQAMVSYTLPTNSQDTPDSLGLKLLSLLQHSKADLEAFKACLVCSVVPPLDLVIRKAVEKYVGCPVFLVPSDLPVPLENRYENPGEVGADRLVCAFAARRLFPASPSLIIVDFGTAATFDCVQADAYLGGLIFPGPATSAAALASHAAKLPNVGLDIQATEAAPCSNTSTSISHGLVFGFVAVAEGLCARLKRRLKAPVTILATGGFANVVARLSSIFDSVQPSLLLDGLRGLYLESARD